MQTPKITRQQASNALTSGVAVFALASSYWHGKEFAEDNHAGHWSWGVAAIPEALMTSALLQDKRDWRFAAKMGVAIAWTFGVNAAGALASGFDPARLIVALLAPFAAVLCAATNHGKPAKAAKKAAKKPGVVEGGIAWAKRQKTVPDVAKIQAARGCSPASARKIYEGAFGKQAV